MELRNASVKLPADLHQQIKDELEAKNITMSQFLRWRQKNISTKRKAEKQWQTDGRWHLRYRRNFSRG